jgi:hypothetical protein
MAETCRPHFIYPAFTAVCAIDARYGIIPNSLSSLAIGGLIETFDRSRSAATGDRGRLVLSPPGRTG